MEQAINLSSKEQHMFALVAQLESSNLTVRDFCALHGVAPGTYYYWQKKVRLNSLPTKDSKKGFTLLKVPTNERDPIEAGLFAEYRGIRFYREVSVCFLKALIS